MSTNPVYAEWVATTGGGPNWEFTAWVRKMKTYKICDTATHEPETIEASSAAAAIKQYLSDGYATMTFIDGELEPHASGRYSVISAWVDDDECVEAVEVIADGKGGIARTAPTEFAG